MLDSLGSTLSRSTVESFWTRFNKRSEEEPLTVNEAIRCLETELCRPASEKKRINPDEHIMDTSAPVTPAITSALEAQQQSVNFDKLDFSGHRGTPGREREASGDQPGAPPMYTTEPMQQPLEAVAQGLSMTPSARTPYSTSSSDAEDSSNGSSGSSPEASFERLINVKNCPLCHRPRLNSKAEVDIVTHLAVCASQDWARVDKIVVGNYVTANQAQRKWYTKVISKVSAGDYKLGAVSSVMP